MAVKTSTTKINRKLGERAKLFGSIESKQKQKKSIENLEDDKKLFQLKLEKIIIFFCRITTSIAFVKTGTIEQVHKERALVLFFNPNNRLSDIPGSGTDTTNR